MVTPTLKWRNPAGRVASFDLLFTIINSVFMLMAVMNGLASDEIGILLGLTWAAFLFFRFRIARNLLKSADKSEELSRALDMAIGWGKFSVIMIYLNVIAIFSLYYGIVAQIGTDFTERGDILYAILVEVSLTTGIRSVFMCIVDQYVVELESVVPSSQGTVVGSSLIEVNLIKFLK